MNMIEEYWGLIMAPLYIFAGMFLIGVSIPFILRVFTGYSKKYKREDFNKLDEIAYKLSGIGGKGFAIYFLGGFALIIIWLYFFSGIENLPIPLIDRNR